MPNLPSISADLQAGIASIGSAEEPNNCRILALSYFDAAKLIEPNRKSVPQPYSHLLAHSAELALKSFLLAHGYTPKDLVKQDIRHNIVGLLEKAMDFEDFGSLADEHKNELEDMSRRHADFISRYPKTHAIVIRAKNKEQPAVEALFRALGITQPDVLE